MAAAAVATPKRSNEPPALNTVGSTRRAEAGTVAQNSLAHFPTTQEPTGSGWVNNWLNSSASACAELRPRRSAEIVATKTIPSRTHQAVPGDADSLQSELGGCLLRLWLRRNC